MGDSNQQSTSSSPLKACLIAPTFSSSRGKKTPSACLVASSTTAIIVTTTASATPGMTTTTAVAGRNSRNNNSSNISNISNITSSITGKDSSSSSSSTTAHCYSSVIDDAVRKAYKKVKRGRDAKRQELVRRVLRESRDEAIHEILVLGKIGKKVEHAKQVDQEVEQNNTNGNDNGIVPPGMVDDTKCKDYYDDGVVENEKKRRNNSDGDDSDIEESIPSSLHRRKRKKSGNNDSTTLLMANDDDDDDDDDDDILSEEKNNDSEDDDDMLLCSNNDENDGSEGNDNLLLNASSLPGERTPHQTLVFPRLPSNGCPSYQIFTPPLCSSSSSGPPYHKEEEEEEIDEDEDGVNNNNDTPTLKTALPPNLSNPNKGQPKEYSLTIKSHACDNNTITTATHHHHHHHNYSVSPLLLIEGTHPPRPKSSTVIFLESALAVEDEPSLSHVPYFEDGDNEDIYSDLFDTTERERLYEFGPKYREEETLETIDEVLKLLIGDDDDDDDDDNGEKEKCKGAMMGTESKLICLAVSEIANVDVERVHDRQLRCFECPTSTTTTSAMISTTTTTNGGSDEPKEIALPREERHPRCFLCPTTTSTSTTTNGGSDETKQITSPREEEDDDEKLQMNSDATSKVPYENILDSYRDLFCRRCFTYDCNLHGNLPKASLGLLGELAVQKEVDGHWKEFDSDTASEGTSNIGMRTEDSNNEMTPVQQSICKRAHVIFQGDIDRVSRAMGAMPASVDALVKSEKMELEPNEFVTSQSSSSRKNGNRAYCSMKNYNQKWLRRIQSKVILPAFLPCDHDGPCNDRNCSCVSNGFFCHKACGWGAKSPNFFRGCECKAGQCQTKTCPCFAAKRECDPDLCRTCGACADPPGRPAREGGQRCRNDGISMGRHSHLLIAESKIKQAGWGLFTKHAMKKGDFVHEYVGEIISQEEAERRGVIYDKLNMSYLFNLSSDLVVDSTRKGNKARYANHSSTPNIEPKTIHVNGDMRIGFYAKHDIDAQSELFFDYRYDDQMDNELIFKPDHSVNFEWMNKNNQGQKKKNT